MEALSEGEGADGDAHPALTCQLVDRLAAEINSKQYWTKSSLATNLENAVRAQHSYLCYSSLLTHLPLPHYIPSLLSLLSPYPSSPLALTLAQVRKQWRPIIADNRQALQAAGVRLAALGLVEVVGRPVVMLYPVWLLLQQALLVVKGMETGEVSPRTVLAALKAVLLLALSSQLLALLALYQGMGYACLLMGGLALAASTSDAHVKALAPIIAPHLAHLDAFLERVGGAEAAAMRAMGLDDRRGGRPLSPHPQVSQLPPDTPEPERDEGSEDEQPHTQPQGEGEGEGLRRRGNRGATSPTWTSSTG